MSTCPVIINMCAIDPWISYIMGVILANSIVYLPHVAISVTTTYLILNVATYKRITDTATMEF